MTEEVFCQCPFGRSAEEDANVPPADYCPVHGKEARSTLAVAANLPEVVVPHADPVDVAEPIGMPSPTEWQAFQQMAEHLSRSGLVPSALRRKPDDVLLVLLTGRDLRIAPTTALSKIHVIEGKPTISAELMAGLVNRQPGMAIWPDPANNAEKATAHALRDGREMSFTFTIDDARRAGLVTKGTWTKWPMFMLWARAVSGLCRMAFSDVLAGVAYTPEEMGAHVDPETGEVLDVPSRPADESPYISPTNVAAARAKAEEAGLTPDDIADMVSIATLERTEDLTEVYKTEVEALRDALHRVTQRKAAEVGS